MGVDCSLYLLYGTRLREGVKYEDIPERMIEGHKNELFVIYDGMCGKDHFIGYLISNLGQVDYDDLESKEIDLSYLQNMQVSLLNNAEFLKLTDNKVPQLFFVAHYS